MATVPDTVKARVREFLTTNILGTHSQYTKMMKEKFPDEELITSAYFYLIKGKMKKAMLPPSSAPATPKPLPVKKVKARRRHRKNDKKKRKRSPTQLGNLIDLNELRMRLQKQGVSVKEHDLMLETWTKMRLLNPALADVHIWEGADGRPNWEIKRVSVAHGIG
jgi:hypothetical protein